ncbi:MAG: c-type cytochrome [Gammaproteobacteria bacterium]|nr:MAG: c-type cytochrome [Gammaproteobacteria bacterium]
MKCVFTALLLCLFSYTCLAAQQKTPLKTKAAEVIVGDIEAGKFKSEDNRCQECHGADGNGQGPTTGAAGKFAKLSGQYPDYLTKQIRNFRSGERKSEFMQIMAKSIDDTDSADIAAYFASQKKMQGDGSGKNEVGKNLFINGDATRNILPCTSCHGVDGRGIDAPQQLIPVIGGQEWRYLEKQLQDWRSGERHNSDGNLMNTFTKQLSDLEVQSLTDYISGL